MEKICVLNKYTNRCVGVYDIENISNWRDHGDFVLSPRHDGQSGWTLENGEWIDPFIKIKSQEEKWIEVRAKRDNLLEQSDIYIFEDYPITIEQKNLVINYRQTLRDIPQTYTNPDNIVWPDFIL